MKTDHSPPLVPLLRHLRFVTALVLGLVASAARAEKPVLGHHFDLEWSAPNRKLGEPLEIRIKVTSSSTAPLERLRSTVSPLRTVAGENSDAAHLILPAGASVVAGVARFPLTVKREGEFSVEFEGVAGGVQAHRKLFVLAVEGRVWLGRDSIESAEWDRVTGELGVAEADYTPNLRERRERIYRERVAERARAKAKPRHDRGQAAPAASLGLKSGDTAIFKGTWAGPGMGGSNAVFALDGARIKLTDTAAAGGAAVIEGVIRAGEFRFPVPRDDYEFIAEISTDFQGIDATGAVLATGKGIGAFQQFKEGAADTAGPMYVKQLTNVLEYAASRTADGDSLGSAWIAFHGMIEMVVQARKQLQVSKDADFKVIFESSRISRFSSATDTVFILLQDRNDWDVVAHEFGHAVADEHELLGVAVVGGTHTGGNQYDLAANANTLNDKGKSLTLAFNEGFGTYFGASLLERSDYKGKFANVGDKKYDDTEDSNVAFVMDSNAAPQAFGDDTEEAIQALFWDLFDAQPEVNTRTATKIAGLRDGQAIGLGGMWRLLANGKFANISDFWKKSFLPESKLDAFLNEAKGAIDGVALGKAIKAADSFAEFGIAPVLFKPDTGTVLNLATNKGPKFEWTQLATVNADLALNKFQLLIYLQDLKTLVFKSAELVDVTSYELTEADLESIRAKLENAGQASVTAVVAGSSDKKAPTTGPYLSNGLGLLLQNFNRAVVMVIDSSGSNNTTDPSNQRVVASAETIRRLTSIAEGLAGNQAPDLAGVIDFDSSVKVLSPLADPDVAVATVNRIDSSGGTCIDCGIGAAIQQLDDINAAGFRAFVKDRASIVVFTDGENSRGPAPVIQAIVAATLKGIRVHFGFLNPIGVNRSASRGEPDEPPVGRAALPLAEGAPTTIEEAVRLSGGVYAVISDAASQVAFVSQIYERGLVNLDRSDTSGGAVAGQTQTSDSLIDGQEMKSYSFRGKAGEAARVIVRATGFQPFLTVFAQDGSILGTDRDDDGDGRAEIPVTLPYEGEYVAEVFSRDGRPGSFTFFVDVQNDPLGGLRLEKVGEVVLDLQTGLFMQQIRVVNQTAGSVPGLRLLAAGLAAGAQMIPATGTNDGGVPFIEIPGPLAAGATITLRVGFYVADRSAPSGVTLSVEEATVSPPPPPLGAAFAVRRAEALPSGAFLVEFDTVVGATYVVQYGPNGLDWTTAAGSITATGGRLVWVDDGPPLTDAKPGVQGERFYRVIRTN
jgi:hypothetical protein